MKNKGLRLFGIITAIAVSMTFSADVSSALGSINAFAEEDSDIVVIAPQEDINRDEDLADFVEPEYTAMYSFPSEMRGVYITPTVDYAAANEDGAEKSSEEITDEVEKCLIP